MVIYSHTKKSETRSHNACTVCLMYYLILIVIFFKATVKPNLHLHLLVNALVKGIVYIQNANSVIILSFKTCLIFFFCKTQKMF